MSNIMKPWVGRRGQRIRSCFNGARTGRLKSAKARIALVDHNTDTLRILMRSLKREGYRCVTAASGPAALELLRETPVDMVLVAYQMPGMDGCDVCGELRRDSQLRDIPVILLACSWEYAIRRRAIAVGVSDYLIKRFDEEQLHDLVSKIEAQLHASKLLKDLDRIEERLRAA